MTSEISILMLKDHAKLNAMLSKTLELQDKDLLLSKQEFIAFKEHFEKHIAIEDQAIFSIFEKMNLEQTPIVFRLIEQHQEIIGLLKENEKIMNKNQKPELLTMAKLIKSHLEIEKIEFYEKLKNQLTAIENQKILKSIKNIIY